jgi:hypothetical protein
MRMHKNLFALTLAASAVLGACTATTPTEAATPGAAPAGLPPGASGKLSPEMVGKVSPVPAFMGLGEHFKIDIQSEGGQTPEGLRHRVHLVWGTGSREAGGMLFYRGAPGPAHGAPIALDGRLETTTGSKPIRVEIVTEACTDDADVAHPQRVTVTVQGETAMRGCGELAVY